MNELESKFDAVLYEGRAEELIAVARSIPVGTLLCVGGSSEPSAHTVLSLLFFARRTKALTTLIPERREELDVLGDNGVGLLHVACDGQNVRVVNAILAAGADPNLLDGGRWSPLERLMAGPPGTVRDRIETRLIEAGAKHTDWSLALSGREGPGHEAEVTDRVPSDVVDALIYSAFRMREESDAERRLAAIRCIEEALRRALASGAFVTSVGIANACAPGLEAILDVLTAHAPGHPETRMAIEEALRTCGSISLEMERRLREVIDEPRHEETRPTAGALRGAMQRLKKLTGWWSD